MPLGRKHFRRSRDAPIRKGLLASPVVKDRLLKSCIYLSRTQPPIKRLDDIAPLGDSKGNAPVLERTESRTVGTVAKHASGKKRQARKPAAMCLKSLRYVSLPANLLLLGRGFLGCAFLGGPGWRCAGFGCGLFGRSFSCACAAHAFGVDQVKGVFSVERELTY